MNKSEIDFAQYCASRGYDCRQLEVNGRPVPDFEVLASGARIVAEIKEFRANAHDREQARELMQHGISGGEFDGRRVRRAIEEAAPQLRTFASENVPLLVVLYDNIVVNGTRPYGRCPYFDPTQIEWGMYGQHVAEFDVPPRGKPIWLGDRRGGNRELTQDTRAYISAVAVLAEQGEFAWFYHNYFARITLSRKHFGDERDRHFHNPSDPLANLAGWAELSTRG
jgi:hypothetical protein